MTRGAKGAAVGLGGAGRRENFPTVTRGHAAPADRDRQRRRNRRLLFRERRQVSRRLQSRAAGGHLRPFRRRRRSAVAMQSHRQLADCRRRHRAAARDRHPALAQSAAEPREPAVRARGRRACRVRHRGTHVSRRDGELRDPFRHHAAQLDPYVAHYEHLVEVQGVPWAWRPRSAASPIGSRPFS